MVILFLIIAAFCFLLFLHPYFTYPLSLKLFSTASIETDPNASLPSASMLFCAYNEERSLPGKIENLREIKQRYPDIEILAYSDCSSDNTLALLKAQEPGLLRAFSSAERAGKAMGMRKLVAEASGDILIFTDANVILAPDAINALLLYFSNPDIGGVGGTLRYINEDESATAKVGGLYWRLEEWLKKGESRVGSMMGADGSIFAIRRSLYPVVPANLLDDMTVSMTVTFRDTRLIYADDVIAFEKSATSSSDEFRRKRRIACRAFNTHRHLWSQIREHYGPANIYKYVSHKLIRWFGLVPLGLSWLFGLAGLAMTGQSLLPLAYLGLTFLFLLLGALGVPVIRSFYQILLSITATFIGITDSLRGKTYQTWTPALSRD